MNTFLHVLKQFLSLAMVGFGVFMYMIFGFISLFSENVIENNIVAFSILVLLPMVLGVLTFIVRIFTKKKFDDTELEVEIVKFAQQHGGLVSIPEIIVRYQLAPTKVQDKMRELSEKGVFEARVTDKGAVVYSLISYSSAGEKQRASSVI